MLSASPVGVGTNDSKAQAVMVHISAERAHNKSRVGLSMSANLGGCDQLW